MSNIALRAYQQKIEYWIEENKIDKAIYQSSLILQQFPKNLRTYQILSKALLQKQDFISAEKVFDIILQIEPDDFVSHIGKSMVAEYNKKLDLALDHMKHAFEIQPSNEGLQNELKRLSFLKDGVELTKVNLTRGALIKMYLKGKLYQQAISESRIGLSETPKRIDYKIAMANSYFETGDFIQAVETCIEITSQFPYCWTANEILDKVITKNHTIENDGFFHKRLIELDPYYAFMLSSTQTVLDIPDIAVMVIDQSDRDDFAYDLEPLFANSWNSQNQMVEKGYAAVEEVDWDSIITKAVEAPTIHANFNEGDLINDRDDFPNSNLGENTINSRRNVFLERLRPSKKPAVESPIIPEWFFDENDEITQFENESNFDELDIMTKNDPTTSVSQEQIESVSDEDGVFDSDIQPAVDQKEELERPETTWINDEEGFIQTSNTPGNTPLDDTQQISIHQDESSDLLQNSSKALEGGDTQFAFNTLRKLISEKNDLPSIAAQLERAIDLYPDRTDFQLLLGETYAKLEEKEKALTILQNAQKLISL